MQDWDRSTAVGVVGVGVMGGGMAANLLDRGHALVACDVDAARLDAMQRRGARVAASPREVAGLARVQICMVETTAQAESVIVGPSGLAEGLQPGDRVLCCSTIDPQAAVRMAHALREKGAAMLDAPVSGGQARADAGDLTAIVGGDADVLADVRAVVEGFASRIFHVGDVGSGLAMKLVNNMMVQTTTVALAEAFVLGAKAGLDPETIHQVLRVSTGASAILEMRAPRFLSGDWTPGGTVDINYKDQELETAFAKQLGVPMLMANVSQQVFKMGQAAGLGKLDSASLITLYEQWAGVEAGERES